MVVTENELSFDEPTTTTKRYNKYSEKETKKLRQWLEHASNKSTEMQLLIDENVEKIKSVSNENSELAGMLQTAQERIKDLTLTSDEQKQTLLISGQN